MPFNYLAQDVVKDQDSAYGLITHFQNLIDTAKQTIERLLSSNEYRWDTFRVFETSIELISTEACKLEFALYRSGHNRSLQDAHLKIEAIQASFWHDLLCHKTLNSVFHKILTTSLEEEQKLAVAHWIEMQEHAGVNLDLDQQNLLADYKLELQTLKTKFNNNVTTSRAKTRFTLTSHQLDGISESYLPRVNDHGSYYIDLGLTYKILLHCKNRETREVFYKAYNTIASLEAHHDAPDMTDNTAIANQINGLYQKISEIFGFKHYSDMSISRDLNHNSDKIENYLVHILDETQHEAILYLRELEAFAMEQENCQFQLQPWDIQYYALLHNKKLFVHKHNITFSLEKVFLVVKRVFHSLFGLHIEEEVVDQDLIKWAITDTSNNRKSIIYLDLMYRSNKVPGAMMFNYHTPVQDTDIPASAILANFNGTEINAIEVRTLLHELGHALHHILSNIKNCTLFGLGGVGRSLIELPSQMMEFIFLDREYVQQMLGIPLIPSDIDHLIDYSDQSPIQTYGQVLLSLIDCAIFSTSQDVKVVSKTIRDKYALDHNYYVPYNMINSFLHIFASNYSAGYYIYHYSLNIGKKMLSSIGDLNQTLKHLKTNFLERGGTIRPEEFNGYLSS